MKQWKCTLCGYIHTGDEPPEKCPVCGADKSKFILVEPAESEAPEESAEAPKTSSGPSPTETPPGSSRDRAVKMALDLMSKHHVHPISVHIPNGVLPVSVIFIFIAAVFNVENLALAAFYNMVFVLLSMPLVLFTGFNEWRLKYNQVKSGLFIAKIAAAGVVLATTLISVLWSAFDPLAALPGSSHRGLFLALHLVMLVAAGVSGFIGGKLVFKD